MNQNILSNNVRVLVVDDSAVIRGLVSQWLKTGPAIEIAGTADNGERAISAYQRVEPDVVVLDIEMPAMNCIDARQ